MAVEMSATLRQRLFIFKNELEEEEAKKLTKLCGRFKDRVQCFHLHPEKSDTRMMQMISKQVRMLNGKYVERTGKL